MPAVAYYLLQLAILHNHGRHSVLAHALGSDLKGKLPPMLYLAAIALAFYMPWLLVANYVLVAVLWLVPDRRIEKALPKTCVEHSVTSTQRKPRSASNLATAARSSGTPVPSRADVASSCGKAAGRLASATSTSVTRRASSAGLTASDLVSTIW
jgi:hypothetical protein